MNTKRHKHKEGKLTLLPCIAENSLLKPAIALYCTKPTLDFAIERCSRRNARDTISTKSANHFILDLTTIINHEAARKGAVNCQKNRHSLIGITDSSPCMDKNRSSPIRSHSVQKSDFETPKDGEIQTMETPRKSWMSAEGTPNLEFGLDRGAGDGYVLFYCSLDKTNITW